MKSFTRFIPLFFVVGILSSGGSSTVTAEGSVNSLRGNWPDDTVSQLSKVQLNDQSTLDDYLTFAAINNAGLEAAFNRWKAELEVVHQSGVLPDPRFSYGNFIQNVETRVGPQDQRFGISQMFPWLGKLKLRKEASTAMANMAEQQFQTARVKLFNEVKQAYFDYFYLGRAIAITRENVDLLTEFEKIARTRYETGSALYADLLRAQVELDKLKDREQTLKERIPPTLARLNATLSRSSNAPIPIPDSIPDYAGDFEMGQLKGELRVSNPELKAIDFLAEKENTKLKLARKEYYPDVTLGLDIIDTKPAQSPTVRDSGKDAVVLGFSVNLPIWRQKIKSGVAEFQKRHLAATQSRTDLENLLTAKLELEAFKYSDAERKVALYRDSLIDKAKQTLNVSKSEFESGNIDFLSLIDAERILLDFQLNYEQAVTNRAKARAAMERIVGKPF